MSGHSYIQDDTQRKIRNSVTRALQEICAGSPPISFDDLYTNARLQRSLFSPEQPEYAELVGRIGADASSLRGCLFVKDKQVIVRDDGYPRRVNFVLAHEFAHWNLPWHQALLYKCTQFDLSAAANKQLEREANFYASEISFMGREFTTRLESSPISLKHLLSLSDEFEMSRESTFRRAVEIELRECAIMSLRVNEESEDDFLKVAYSVHSPSFIKQYGQFDHRQTFNRQHELARIVMDPFLSVANRYDCNLTFANKHKMHAEIWKNKWNVFALILPVQQPK